MATVELSNCVKDILCGLSHGVRNALASLIRLFMAQIDAQIALLSAQLVYLDILSAPPQLAKVAVDAAVAQVKQYAQLIPFSLVAGCVGMSDLSLGVQANLDAITSTADIILDDLSRLLSFRDEIQAILEDLETIRDLYAEVLNQVSLCAVVESVLP